MKWFLQHPGMSFWLLIAATAAFSIFLAELGVARWINASVC